MQHGNGKRWLVIGLLVLGGFWLVNDSYDDGYRDALVQTGQAQNVRHYYGGPHFPWGLLILGGIGYVAWRKGAFDRFGGPGGPFNGGHQSERGMQRFGAGNAPAYTPGRSAPGPSGSSIFHGPRAFFEDWHRQAHEEAARTQHPAPPASPTPPAGVPGTNHGASQGGFPPTPPPTPPAAEYWESMPGSAEATGTTGTTVTPPSAADPQQEDSANTHPAAGTAV